MYYDCAGKRQTLGPLSGWRVLEIFYILTIWFIHKDRSGTVKKVDTGASTSIELKYIVGRCVYQQFSKKGVNK